MDMAGKFAEILLTVSLEGTVLIISLWAASGFLDRHFSLRWQKWCWLLLSIRLLLLFRIPLWPGMHGTGRGLFLSGGVSSVLVSAWAVGFLFSLTAGLFHYRRFQKEVLETAQEITEEAVLEQLGQVREELLLTRPVKLCRSSLIHTPMAAGFFSPVLLLPDRPYSREELRLIFCHEGMHIDHWDVPYKLILAAAAAVHWFNPFVWRMKKLAFRDLELICDAHVVEGMDYETRGLYGRTILDSLSRETQPDLACSTSFFGSRQIMKRRLDQILETGDKKKGTFLFATVLLAVLCLEGLLPGRPQLRTGGPKQPVTVEFLNGTGTVE